MSIAMYLFYFAVPFMMILDSVLSFFTAVGGYEWPIYDREV